jgi:hypothetical protein
MSAYFSLFPITDYSFDKKNFFYIVDFTTRVKILDYLTTSNFIYDSYSVVDGERPEDIAFTQYGSSNLHWIILMTNEIIDPTDDWCLAYKDLVEVAKKKYTDIFATHHYVDSKDLIRDQSDIDLVDVIPVSNLQYEVDENEKKRLIKLLKPSFVSQFVDDFQKVIST